MTPPPAATAAGARLRPAPAPRVPRRRSGPARRRASTRAAVALPAPGRLRTGRVLPRPSLRGAAGAAGAAARGMLARIVALLHGRALIAVLAAALLGLVFLQVSMLRLNTAISANVERSQQLERDNAAQKALISRLDAGKRIQDVAAQLGMVMPGAGAVCYLDARRQGACSGGDPAAATGALDPGDATIAEPAVDPEVVAAQGAEDGTAAALGEDTGAPAQETAPAGEAAPAEDVAPAGDPAAEAAPAEPQVSGAAPTGGVDGAIGAQG